ncbi:hypothetical protein [Phenylobacterium sp.]|uniref:hypothetical protein n=1 Tax=Phenylobacterium sp. TaxID=1871053 RepID=UPI00122486D5|nr:hypothetical protein [Phenylobacterium sp.]THD58845.1 MAG: hypothetical protein E8A49_17785 [Phenylobacterium sp.]
MIMNLARAAYRLDEWLQEKFGRPYNLFLGIGLVLGIIHQVQSVPKDLASPSGLVGTVLIGAMDVALLINQGGQFFQHVERRRAMPRRERRRDKAS